MTEVCFWTDLIGVTQVCEQVTTPAWYTFGADNDFGYLSAPPIPGNVLPPLVGGVVPGWVDQFSGSQPRSPFEQPGGEGGGGF